MIGVRKSKRRSAATSARLGTHYIHVKMHVACEVNLAVKALNRMLERGRPIRVRTA